MEKLHHEIKRMVNDVSIPEKKLEETIQVAFNNGKKLTKSPFFKKQPFLASIASLFVIAIGAMILTSYIDEENINGQTPEESILFQTSDEGIKRMVEEGKVSPLDLEAEDQGIKVSLQEAYLDHYQLVVSYKISDPEFKLNQAETSIGVNLLVDGQLIAPSGFGGLKTKSLIETGGTFTFRDTSGYPKHAEYELQITNIDHLEGEWNFPFALEMDDEYLVKTDLEEKSDSAGNSFSISKAELTPTMLLLHAKTKMIHADQYPELSFQRLSIETVSTDGYTYIQPDSRRASNSNKAYSPRVIPSLVETIEIPREMDVYSYKVTPYNRFYKGEIMKDPDTGLETSFIFDELIVPFTEGSTIEKPTPIHVERIIYEQNETFVHYKIDVQDPFFPMIRDGATAEDFYAQAYKIHEDYVEVIYPKMDPSLSYELFTYDGTYEMFPDLRIEIDFN